MEAGLKPARSLPQEPEGTRASVSERLTRQSGTNFYYAFRLLPRAKRAAIYALYAFCRSVDDCADAAGGAGEEGLVRWEEELARCYAGRPETEIGRDLALAVSRFPIRAETLTEIIAGCRMDLTRTRYEAWADLEVYCRRVASAVGLASIEIFGYRSAATREFAVHLGLALQLTNILRDVAADAARDRLYLPLSDLRQFGVSQAELWASGPGRARRPELTALLAFEADRAREQFRLAELALPRQDRRAMISALAMGAIYRALLERLARRGYPVGGPRVRLSTLEKLGLAVRVCARCWLRP